MVELVLYIVLGVVLGFFIGSLFTKLNFEKSKTAIEKEKSSLQEKVALLLQSETTLKNTIDEKYYWIGKRKMSAAKSMGQKMTKVLEKNQEMTAEKTGLDAFL